MTEILQNVVFPEAEDPDMLSLYLDPETWSVIDEVAVRVSSSNQLDNIRSRSSVVVAAGSRVSFGTYFNAFPASYWQRWSVVEEVLLEIETSGSGTIIVYRSNSNGSQQRVASRIVSGDAASEFRLQLGSFGDGGWYWFDLVGGREDLLLRAARWSTEAEPTSQGKLSLGMTTFNKPDYCVATLKNISANPALLAAIDQIIVVDQGTQRVEDESEYPQLSLVLGDKLRVIEQVNLGGSGGFARAMAEALELESTDFLLLLDDDVEFETESALRAHQLGKFSREPVIVGGHMFDLLDKPVIHAWAEVVRPEPFLWGPSFDEQHRHDFRVQNLRQTPWMHARLDADYNGWWMCLIPKTVIEEVGLPLPVFIKWDDAEYALRARSRGFRTVSLPGVALWHVSWLDKDDTQDWQAFFHTRNRIIAGLLHSEKPRGGGLLKNSGRQDLKKLLNMQYYAVQLAVDALKAVLAGPQLLHLNIASDMPKARAAALDFPETRVYKPQDPESPLALNGRALPFLGRTPKAPAGLKLGLFTMRMTALHWLRNGKEAEAPQPDLEYAKRDAFWWQIPSHQSVIVGTADGSGKAWYRHDRRKFRRLLRESRQLTRRILRQWERLAEEYRRALPTITSPEEWRKTFDGR